MQPDDGTGEKKPATKPRRARERRTGRTILILVVVSYAAILILGPLVAVVWGAFSQGAGRLVNELSSEQAIRALELTLFLGLGATVINTVFGLCIAYVLVRDRFPGRRFLNGLVDLPFAVSPVIAGLMLILLFGRGGWLEPVLNAAGIKIVFAVPGMLLATSFVSLPFVIREVMPILQHVGTAYEEAAYTMGAGKWQAFWKVTLPSIRWGLVYGIVLTTARSLGEFGAVLVVSGGIVGLTETSTLFIFRMLDDRNVIGAYGMALVLALLSFTLMLFVEFWKSRSPEFRGGDR